MLLALRRHPWLTAAFFLFTALALWLLVETFDHARGWHGAPEEEVRPWMTVGYVGRSWELDPRAIDGVAGLPLPEEAGRPLTLQEIADRRGVPVEDIVVLVEEAIRTLREEERAEGRDDRPGSALDELGHRKGSAP